MLLAPASVGQCPTSFSWDAEGTNLYKSEIPVKLIKRIRSLGMGVALAATALFSTAAPVTQLGFLVDASGSIGTTNFNIMRSGYAAALAALPVDGSIEITMYSFATGTVQVVAPTVVTAATLPTILAQVNAMAYTAGSTFMNLGINAITAAMTASSNFAGVARSIVNMATDGSPSNDAAALTSASAMKAAGIDAFTAEAIGSGADTGFLRDIVFSPVAGPCNNCGVVLADGSTPPNPMTSTPWVLVVNQFSDFPTAINAKVQAITVDPDPNAVPEPGSIALVGGALALLMMARRRKA